MILNFPNRRIGSLAIPESGDGDIHVPNTLQPVSEVSGPVGYAVAGSGFTRFLEPLMGDSHILSVTRTQPASSAAATVGISLLKAGLWHIIIHATSIGNFLPATQLTFVGLADPSNLQNLSLVDQSFASGVVTKDFIDFIFSPPVDGWEFFLQQGTTAAAQSIMTVVTFVANRLG